MRLFIGFGIDNNTRNLVYSLQNKLRTIDHVKWVNPEHMHLTLVFLGEMPYKENIIAVLEKSKDFIIPLLNIKLLTDAITLFPDRKNPRVIAMALKDMQKHLVQIQTKILLELRNIGLNIHNNRKYIPHITLGRVLFHDCTIKADINCISSEVQLSSEVKLSGLRLYSSILKPKGPDYKIEYEIV